MTENNSPADCNYFFYGYPANYALVGAHDRRIWLVLSDEKLAHELRTVFASKISLVVFDITTFKNYNPNLIDNGVCLSWSVPVQEYISCGIARSIVTPIFNSTHQSSSNCELVNSVPIFNFLSKSSQEELQKQLMFFYYLKDTVFKKNKILFLDYLCTQSDVEFDQKITSAFTTELTITEIENKLIDIANSTINSADLTTRTRRISFNILELFGKLYG